MKQVTMDMIHDARMALDPIIYKIPIFPSEKIGPQVFLKPENLQKTGSFKIRGAYNKIHALTSEEKAKGIIACSSGNHAQGVAYSAKLLGVQAHICMPENAPEQKINATRSYGGKVILVPGVYDDAEEKALQLAEEKDYTFIHPFNDPLVIAGQGTIGFEILEGMPDVEQILVPVGGGGLISGIATVVKTLKPRCRIIGVQAESVSAMYASFVFQDIVKAENQDTVADGIHVLRPGNLTFEIINRYVDDIVTVSEEEIIAAMVRLLEWPKLVVEGAGATSVAAYMANKVDQSLKTVCLLSGGNVDITMLHNSIELRR